MFRRYIGCAYSQRFRCANAKRARLSCLGKGGQEPDAVLRLRAATRQTAIVTGIGTEQSTTGGRRRISNQQRRPTCSFKGDPADDNQVLVAGLMPPGSVIR